MCGKFTQQYSWRKLVALYRIHEDPEELARVEASEAGAGDDRVETSTPMRSAWVVTLDDMRRRRRVRMRWGFARKWDDVPGRMIMHARCETIDEKRSFREAFAERRGILIVRTFNEGEEISPTKTRQHVVTPRDGKPVGIAVIWQHETLPDGAPVLVYCMVTTPPNKLIGTITDRMPAILTEDMWSKWLGEEPASLAELKAMLKPFEGDWDMGPQDPSPKPPRPPRPPKQPEPRKMDKPSQGGLFE